MTIPEIQALKKIAMSLSEVFEDINALQVKVAEPPPLPSGGRYIFNNVPTIFLSEYDDRCDATYRRIVSGIR